MNAHGINILYITHGYQLVLGVTYNLEFQLFPSQHGFLDEDLPDKAGGKTPVDDGAELLDVVNQATARSTHSISGTYDAGQADILKRFFRFFETVCNLASRHLDAQLIHRILKRLPVFPAFYGIDLYADDLDAVFFQDSPA